MAQLRRIGAVAAAIAVGVAACGGSGTTERRPSSTTLPAPTAPSTTSPPATSATTAPSSGASWTTDQADLLRSGVDPSGATFHGIKRAWVSPSLDGQVYAEALVFGSLVVVATENDTLYGLRATTGQVVWSTHVGTPAPGSALPCGNIKPLGITSTPAIDPTTQRLFALAETYTNNTVGHELVALDATNGRVVFRESADPPGMQPTAQQQRPALAISGGRVYIAYGGLFGDCGRYRGRVVAASTAAPGPLLSFAVSAPNQGAVWAPGGPAVDGAGSVWVATGNAGTSTYDQGNSVLKLSPTLSLLDSFAPANWSNLSAQDLDLGSTSPQLLANGLVFQVGKQGVGYLLDQSHLGGVGGQAYSGSVCSTIGANAYRDPDIYVPCGSGLKAVRVNGSRPPSFQIAWTAASQINGPPIIAGGLIWSVSQSDQTLYGLDPNSGAISERIALGASSANYARPAVGDSLLVVPTGDTVRAFSST